VVPSLTAVVGSRRAFHHESDGRATEVSGDLGDARAGEGVRGHDPDGPDLRGAFAHFVRMVDFSFDVPGNRLRAKDEKTE
jgi:hypothetical protein